MGITFLFFKLFIFTAICSQLYYLSHPLRPLGQGGDNTPGSDSTPNDAAFGFFVMVSPEALQVSLRKRDGTHWEMLDCENTKSEESQIVWMFCNDDSPNSNCNKIYLGHGVPGTILDMPNGCGPGPYAVAVNMVPSKNQSVPGHIKKRTQTLTQAYMISHSTMTSVGFRAILATLNGDLIIAMKKVIGIPLSTHRE